MTIAYGESDRRKVRRPVFAFDYEGPVCNPAVDFAWLIYRRLVSEETKKKFPEALIQTFDEYDDARWERERARRGHSTGTTPLVLDCVAACDDIGNGRLISFAKSCVQENPGIKELIEFLIQQKTVPYFVTNSYPALSLTSTYEWGIPSSKVFSHGYQLSLETRRNIDRQRRGNARSTFEEEVYSRSPLLDLIGEEELEPFLREYLEVCSRLLTAYKQNSEHEIVNLEIMQVKMFDKIDYKDLRNTLKYMFLKEKAITGGHNKARILQKISQDGTGVVYLGDSIVDADPIKFAQYGFATNCTNKHALQDAKLSLVVPDFSLLVPMFEDILKGRFSFERTKGYERNGMRVFLPDEVREKFDYVKSANNEIKAALKALYQR